MRSLTLVSSVFILHAARAYAAPALAERAPSGNKAVIAQMFGWTWDSIAVECTNFLGPAGYGFVQVSPAQETITGSDWWTDYQPVSYTLTGKRGNRSQYSNMISKCHTAGVKVIADTIFNHMTNIASGVGTAGTSFTHYNYPGVYQTQDFHHCTLESDTKIHNYNNAVEVQTCELDNLADLATDTDYVRGKLASYANDLLSLGVDGLRLDAAKHIPNADLVNILSRLTKKPYITQEVIFGSGEPITPAMYTGNGDVQEFRYTSAVKDAFLSGSISGLQNLDNRGWVAGSGANVFIVNHDTERNGNSLNYNSPNNAYTLATIFSLAHPYGTPTILSSYSFSDTNTGPPNSGAGTCSGTGGSGGWLCQHRWIAIAGMVGFRNNVGTAAMTNWVSPASNRIAFGRGASGFVGINNADSAWTATFTTGLPAGSYCDIISGGVSGSSCGGASVTVSSSGSATVTIPARSAFAIHVGAKGTGSTSPGSGSVTVNFAPTVTTVTGENVYVVGSISQLGSWATSSGIALSSASYPVWKASVSLPTSTSFQYKYVKKESNGSFVWESDPNRSSTTGSSGSTTLNDTWR